MDPREKKQKHIQEIRALMEEFSKEHLSPELSRYVLKLWEQIGRKRNYIITGGKKEIWASAVVYVIARLNFLFDKDSPNYLPPVYDLWVFRYQENDSGSPSQRDRESMQDSDGT